MGCLSTKRPGRKSEEAVFSHWVLDASSSTTILTAGWIFSWRTVISKWISNAFSRGSNTPSHRICFETLARGKFQEVTRSLGSAFGRPRVSRGAAYGDFDNDGDLDIVMTTNGGPAVLLRNDGGANHSLRLRLAGTRSNRDGLGAVVRVSVGGETQSDMVRSGSSYLSQSERTLTFGLGKRLAADSVEIRWPSGQVDRLTDVRGGKLVTVVEGSFPNRSR